MTKIHYPIDEYISQVETLLKDIKNRVFDFQGELDEIRSITVELSSSPEESLDEFNNQYALLTAYVHRVASILIEVYAEKSYWQEFKSRSNSLYWRARNYLLTHREDIKKLRNKELQEASVHQEIPELVRISDYVDRKLQTLDTLISIFKEKKEALDKANSNISRQQKVVESLIGLGHPVVASRGRTKTTTKNN